MFYIKDWWKEKNILLILQTLSGPIVCFFSWFFTVANCILNLVFYSSWWNLFLISWNDEAKKKNNQEENGQNESLYNSESFGCILRTYIPHVKI